jgi:hypothetical protein
MDRDPLDIIADSYRLTAETQQILAQGQRLGLRVQAFALTLIGLSLLGTGVLVWQAFATRQDHAAQTQALTVQTEALREVLRQRQSRP